MDGVIVVGRHGGPEVLEWTNQDPGQPGPGEVLVHHHAIGLNFIDVYHRTGLYHVDPPFTPGVEGTGTVAAVGDGVDGFAIGDEVAYTSNGPVGSYREARVLPASRLVKLPDGVSLDVAAAIMVKGCTVEYLVRRTFPVKAGDAVLLHAAAGGVGLIACQWLSHLGATVIGTVGSEEKGELAKANGCTHVVYYREEDVSARVRELTNGEGVAVAYDSVGADTFEGSIKSLRPRGMMVTYGNASGPVAPMKPLVLAQNGSLFLTRPRILDYYAKPEDAADGFDALFEAVVTGAIDPHIGARYPLREAARAHRDLEDRKTVGSTLLVI